MCSKEQAASQLVVCTDCNNKNKCDSMWDTVCVSCDKKISGGTSGGKLCMACKNHKDLKEMCIICKKERKKITTRSLYICSDCNKTLDFGHKCAIPLLEKKTWKK